jgi:pilus assembly protein TadC
VLVTAVCAGMAATVALLDPTPRRRLSDVLPPAAIAAPPRKGPARGVVRAVCVLGGLSLWWLDGGWFGAAVAMALGLRGPELLARLADGSDDTREQSRRVAAELPLALDLLAACLSGGAPTAAAVSAVASALPGPCAARLQRVAVALSMGSPPGEAWSALGDDRGPAGAAARALARAAESGAPVAAAVQRVAEDARRESRALAERAARRAGVLAVGALGLCFLPAFLVLGVIPAVIGLAGPLLRAH